MFNRTAVMTDQKSTYVSLSDRPSHLSLGGSRRQDLVSVTEKQIAQHFREAF